MEPETDRDNAPAGKKPLHRRALRWFIDIAIILGIVFAVQSWRTRDVPSGPIPDFAFAMAEGGYTTLEAWRAQHPGSATMVYFWADWCPICRTIEGRIDEVSTHWPVLTVAMQSGDSANVQKHLSERGLNWPAAMDERGQLAASLGIRGVPTMLILDPNGHIRFSEMGLSSASGLRLRLWWAQRQGS